ncbi:MAG: hypothetical protein ACI85N_000121 [Gammaproteobacteria bacterium]|jgi:hypothetical protein
MKITNFILFQLAWFITIFSAAKGMPYIGVAYTMIWMFYHLSIMDEVRNTEIKLFLFAAFLGYLLDSILVVAGFITFPEHTFLAGPSPLWMVCLWINLAATISLSLSWLKGRYLLAGAMAAVSGPMAYVAGEKLGAITLFGNTSIFVISIMWCLAMPLLIWASEIFTRQQLIQEQMMSLGLERSK